MLNQDFKEFIELLSANSVRYLVVGGYAVALHGYPRYTKDLDIWVESTKENAGRIIKTLDQFGFDSLGLKSEDFLEEDTIIQDSSSSTWYTYAQPAPLHTGQMS